MFALCARGVACGYEVRFASDVTACKELANITPLCNGVVKHHATQLRITSSLFNKVLASQVMFALRASDVKGKKRANVTSLLG